MKASQKSIISPQNLKAAAAPKSPIPVAIHSAITPVKSAQKATPATPTSSNSSRTRGQNKKQLQMKLEGDDVPLNDSLANNLFNQASAAGSTNTANGFPVSNLSIAQTGQIEQLENQVLIQQTSEQSQPSAPKKGRGPAVKKEKPEQNASQKSAVQASSTKKVPQSKKASTSAIKVELPQQNSDDTTPQTSNTSAETPQINQAKVKSEFALEESKNVVVGPDDDDEILKQLKIEMANENDLYLINELEQEENADFLNHIKMEGEEDGLEEDEKQSTGGNKKQTITDKEFYKAMQKLKDRGTNAVPPKKSASAYILFGKEKRLEILRRNPMAKVTEVVKEIAQSWKLLTKEDRSKYKEAAKRDKERYEKELKSLESHSQLLKKPKKCLSAYMIFVKETRPLIVVEHPEMGALQVMQEVGKKWQAMTQDERNYFKAKADKDKVRYLDEQRAFYDEVEKIGKDIGTVISKDGKVVVASTIQAAFEVGPGKKGSSSKLSTKDEENCSLLSKRKSQPNLEDEDPVLKRQKLDNSLNSIPNQGQYGYPPQAIQIPLQMASFGNQNLWQQIPPNYSEQNDMQAQDQSSKPKRALSAFIHFSQEYREIIKQRFPFYSVHNIIEAVKKRWQSLPKELKIPFEKKAQEDKQRYDAEMQLFKIGAFQGRKENSPKKGTYINDPVAMNALEITNELIEFLVSLQQQTGANDKKASFDEEFPKEYDEDPDFPNDHNDEQTSFNKIGNQTAIKVLAPGEDDIVGGQLIKTELQNPQMIQQDPSLLQQANMQTSDTLQQNIQFNPFYTPAMGSIPPPPMFGQQQIALQYQLQSSLGASPYGGIDPSMMGMNAGFGATQMHLRSQIQNELQNRDIDRKASMCFGAGFGSYYPTSLNASGPGQHIAQSPALHAQPMNLMNSPLITSQNPFAMGQIEDHNQQLPNMNQFMQPSMGMGGAGWGPFQLPPSNNQAQQNWQANQSGSNSFVKQQFLAPIPPSQRKLSSPQIGPSNNMGSGLTFQQPQLGHNISFGAPLYQNQLMQHSSAGFLGSENQQANQSSNLMGQSGAPHQAQQVPQPHSNVSPFLTPQNPMMYPPQMLFPNQYGSNAGMGYNSMMNSGATGPGTGAQ